ncbi:hypothetical protein V8C42DRAFT_159286 [Trichoderma barbatum]
MLFLPLYFSLPPRALPASVLVHDMCMLVSVPVHTCTGLLGPRGASVYTLCVPTQIIPLDAESAAPMRLDRKCLRPTDRLMRYRQLGLGTGTCSILLAAVLALRWFWYGR